MLLQLTIIYTVLVTNNAQLFGERRPFTEADKREIIAEGNDLRSTQSSSDLECLRWSDQLASRAMGWAIQCQSDADFFLPQPQNVNDIACYFQGLSATIYTNDIEPYIRDFLFDWVLRGEAAYDYTTNTCETGPGAQDACNNYKRFMSSTAGEIGCGRSRCSSITGSQSFGRPGYVVVCAMAALANQTGRPYTKVSSECSKCNAPFGVSINNNLNQNIIGNNVQDSQCKQYQAGGMCCPVNDDSTVCRNRCLGKWHRLFCKNRGDHYYTTSELETSEAMQLNYKYENFTGAILLPIGHRLFSDECVTACPEKVALHKLWSKNKKDHMYTIDQNVVKKKKGFFKGRYTEEPLAGYVVRRKGQCGATLPIHEYVREGLMNSDHYYHTKYENIRGYKYNGIAFYAWDV